MYVFLNVNVKVTLGKIVLNLVLVSISILMIFRQNLFNCGSSTNGFPRCENHRLFFFSDDVIYYSDSKIKLTVSL